MRIIKLAMLLSVIVSMSSCLLLGIDLSTDPDKQLDDARNLMNYYSRPNLAEHLIHKAMLTYEKRHDSFGLGNANFLYAKLLQSHGVFNSP
jgi:hypothetical protein